MENPGIGDYGYEPSTSANAGYIASGDGVNYFVGKDAGEVINASGANNAAPLNYATLQSMDSFISTFANYGCTVTNIDK